MAEQRQRYYRSFVKDTMAEGEGAWLAQLDSPKWQTWSGYAFEFLCRYHVKNIKKHLGIGSVYAEIFNEAFYYYKGLCG